MTRHLSHVQVVPHFEQRDDQGDVSAPAQPVTNEQGQALSFLIPAAEWRKGWKWQEAFKTLLEQVDPPPNRQARRAAERNGKAPAKK